MWRAARGHQGESERLQAGRTRLGLLARVRDKTGTHSTPRGFSALKMSPSDLLSQGTGAGWQQGIGEEAGTGRAGAGDGCVLLCCASRSPHWALARQLTHRWLLPGHRLHPRHHEAGAASLQQPLFRAL